MAAVLHSRATSRQATPHPEPLGEGAFNGALAVRSGATAPEAIRPVPFRAGKPGHIGHMLGHMLAEAMKPLATRQAGPA